MFPRLSYAVEVNAALVQLLLTAAPYCTDPISESALVHDTTNLVLLMSVTRKLLIVDACAAEVMTKKSTIPAISMPVTTRAARTKTAVWFFMIFKYGLERISIFLLRAPILLPAFS